MSYFGVLGYEGNPIIDEYQNRFFQKLFPIAQGILSEKELSFDAISLSDTRLFLLHPDISSLLLYTLRSDSEDIKQKFLTEFHALVSGNTQELTAYQGNKIHGTDIYLTLQDNNPENTVLGHPLHDKNGMLGWGERPESEWLEVFSKAFQLLREVNPGFFSELNSIIKKIVPMRTSLDVHNSCSYKDCVGTLYLGYTINSQFPELNILEALIHESNHNKLNLIMQSELMHTNSNVLKYYSPYRPDARHIHGIILGVHAIIPVIYVMLQAIESGKIGDTTWKEKTLLYHMKNKIGIRVIRKYAKLTPIGSQIVSDMESVLKLCDMKIGDIGLSKIVQTHLIQSQVKEHFIEVQKNHPYLQY